MPLNVCPYCLREIAKESRDHIFSNFLGGRRRILVCYDCNNKFGKDFEARAAVNTLHRLYISLASWGLPLTRAIPAWRKAFEYQGLDFDLELTNGKVTPRLSKPIVEKDAFGNTVSVSFRSLKELQSQLNEPKNAVRVRKIEKVQLEISPFHVPLDFRVDSDLVKLVIKMCVGIASTLPEHDFIETLLGRMVLDGSRPPDIDFYMSFEDYKKLDDLREPLSHVVYVERRNTELIGIVQFFGVIQLVCFLGRSDDSASDAAVLGILDPITNKETFTNLDPLGLPYPPSRSTAEFAKNWLEKFEKGAVDRGATRPVKLDGEFAGYA